MKWQVEDNIRNFPAWDGGRDTLDRVLDELKGEKLEKLANEVFSMKIPDDGELNDWLWFDRDAIFEYLDIDE